MFLTAISMELSKLMPETRGRKGKEEEKSSVNDSTLQCWLFFGDGCVVALCKITFKNRILYLQMVRGVAQLCFSYMHLTYFKGVFVLFLQLQSVSNPKRAAKTTIR